MENITFFEIKTILNLPFIINFIDYVNCPICDIEIDVRGKEIDFNSSVYCEDCKHIIKFVIVKI